MAWSSSCRRLVYFCFFQWGRTVRSTTPQSQKECKWQKKIPSSLPQRPKGKKSQADAHLLSNTRNKTMLIVRNGRICIRGYDCHRPTTYFIQHERRKGFFSRPYHHHPHHIWHEIQVRHHHHHDCIHLASSPHARSFAH